MRKKNLLSHKLSPQGLEFFVANSTLISGRLDIYLLTAYYFGAADWKIFACYLKIYKAINQSLHNHLISD